jgi:hypothetical protein
LRKRDWPVKGRDRGEKKREKRGKMQSAVKRKREKREKRQSAVKRKRDRREKWQKIDCSPTHFLTFSIAATIHSLNRSKLRRMRTSRLRVTQPTR